MAILLNEHLNLTEKELLDKGIFNAVIGVDTKLFVDPSLLINIKIKDFKSSRKNLLKYFKDVVTLIKVGNNPRTKKIALKKLTFPEPKGVSIGYGNENEDGAGIGPDKALRIFNSALEIHNLGINDPEILEIVGIFEEGFGPDLISDMTINILTDDFCRYTENMGRKLNIPLQYKYKNFNLPKHPYKNEYLLFIPQMLLRDLPVAASWEEVFIVAQHNAALRDKVNALLRSTLKEDRKPTKKDFRKLLWGSKSDLQSIIKIYKKYDAKPYDFKKDSLGLGAWYSVGKDIYRNGTYSVLKQPQTQEEMISASQELVNRFKRAIEDNGTNKVIYGVRDGQMKPFHEEVSQLIFFALADSYCKDRNILLSRETNSGNGPVDFSIGTSYDAKVLFELKKSLNSDIVTGYTNQLKVYQESENAFQAFYIILRLTDKSSKIDEVLRIEAERNKKGEKTPRVIVIDARLKESASKRK